MKKLNYVGLIVLSLNFAQPVLATTWTKCNAENGGTLVTKGEKTFCKAGASMDWWSAYAWCESVGGYILKSLSCVLMYLL